MAKIVKPSCQNVQPIMCNHERNPYIEQVAQRGLAEGLTIPEAFAKYDFNHFNYFGI
jgi:hypothetical protein